MTAMPGTRFSKEHEWVRAEGNKAVIGITYYAQLSLGDIVYVELPERGLRVKAGDTLGVVESVKAVSEVYSPVSGVVVEVNEALTGEPEKINTAPYDSWFVMIELAEPSEMENLMDEENYGRFCIGEG